MCNSLSILRFVGCRNLLFRVHQLPTVENHISRYRWPGYQKAITTMAKPPHVAIIGAGLSGLRCADILTQKGARVTILEARDRIGGRVSQTQVGGHSIDLGPNWIHGTEDNPINTIAESVNATLAEFEEEQVIFSPDGTPLDQKTAIKASVFMWTTVEEGFAYSKKNQDSIPADRSLLDFFKEKLEKTDFTPAEKSACIGISNIWASYVGDPVDRQSLRFFHLEQCVDGSNFFVASTYKKILDNISIAAHQRTDLRLNQPVVKIESTPRKNSNERHSITLTTAAGESHTFDEVVVTCPLGWLKRNQSAFNPALPPRLSQAINSLSYGRLEKVYITFPRAFWHTPTTKPSFAHFLNPSYDQHPQEITWNQDCFSLANFPAPHAHPTLLFYINGPCAKHIVSKISNLPPSSDEYYNTLNSIFHPFYSRLHGYSPASSDCKPRAFLATQWQNDPYAGHGSYSNFQVGLEEGDKDIEILRAGQTERGMWFAGEHTAPFVALGTTTGAYVSGERAARQILGAYGLETA